MKIGVTANYVNITSKMRNLADGDAKTFKGQLDRIRLGLNTAYQGQDNLTGELLQLEKKIDAFSTRMSGLAAAFNQGASDLLTSGNQAVNVGELAPLSKELDFILSNPTTAQMIARNQQILAARSFTEKYQNGAFVTSPLLKGLTGSLFAGASTAALLPLLNTDSSSEGVDGWFREHNPSEYQEAEAEVRRMANQKSFNELEEMKDSFVDTSKYGNEIKCHGKSFNKHYTLKSGGTSSSNCTWYAASRYEEINGKGSLYFYSKVSGDGGNWHNAINKDYFTVDKVFNDDSGKRINDISVIKGNTLAVSDRGDSNANHVVYVEGVATDPNGKTFVYYSEGGNWQKNHGLEGKIQKVEIEKFANEYEYIISAK
ncbi:MAG: hypothetical protein IJU96_02405 [Clostridia bacterium]|nr:hypothetical protein [Clostridia bacterium]